MSDISEIYSKISKVFNFPRNKNKIQKDPKKNSDKNICSRNKPPFQLRGKRTHQTVLWSHVSHSRHSWKKSGHRQSRSDSHHPEGGATQEIEKAIKD